MVELIVSKADEGQTAIKYLQRFLKEAPTSFFYKMMRKKNIVLNGKRIEGNEKLKENDSLKLFVSDDTISLFSGNADFDTKEFEKAFNELKEPEVVYEDKHILIINKTVGLLSQKSKDSDVSCNEWLIGYLLNKKEITPVSLNSFKPSVCNRLDRNTGGLLLFGKNVFGTNTLNKLLRERTVHKYYRTVVSGKIESELNINGFLFKNETNNKVHISDTKLNDQYEYIETEYKPLRYNEKLDITELEVLLVTGKPHQIRAHLASEGHPIIGDFKYGSKNNFGLKHQLLFAQRIEFPELSDYPEISQKSFQIDLKDIFDKYFK